MPLLAVFAAAAQVGLGVHTSHFEPDRIGNGEEWGQRNIESAVGVEQGGILAVELQSFFIGEEHGDAGAVFAGVEDLLGFVTGGIEINFGRAEDGALAHLGLVAVNRVWYGEAGKEVEGFFIFALAAESGCGADAGQIDVA